MSIDKVQVRLYLEEKGWPQARLAKEAGLSQQHINRFLNGKGKLSVAASDRVLAVLVGTTPTCQPIHSESALERIAAALEKIASRVGDPAKTPFQTMWEQAACSRSFGIRSGGL